jgi:hypothetical protein
VKVSLVNTAYDLSAASADLRNHELQRISVAVVEVDAAVAVYHSGCDPLAVSSYEPEWSWCDPFGLSSPHGSSLPTVLFCTCATCSTRRRRGAGSLGCLHTRRSLLSTVDFGGVLGVSWMDLSGNLPIPPVLGFRRHCHDVRSQHVCVMVLARLSEPTRRGGEEF